MLVGPDVAVQVMVGAASIIVSAAALYGARKIGSAAETIEEADRRSRENRAMLTGERDGTVGVFPWLERLDQEVSGGD